MRSWVKLSLSRDNYIRPRSISLIAFFFFFRFVVKQFPVVTPQSATSRQTLCIWDICVWSLFFFLFSLFASERNIQLRRKRENMNKPLRYWTDCTQKIKNHRDELEEASKAFMRTTDFKKGWRSSAQEDEKAKYAESTRTKQHRLWPSVFLRNVETLATQAIFALMFIVREKRINESASLLRDDDYPMLSFESEQISIRRCRSKIMDEICVLRDILRQLQNWNFLFLHDLSMGATQIRRC